LVSAGATQPTGALIIRRGRIALIGQRAGEVRAMVVQPENVS